MKPVKQDRRSTRRPVPVQLDLSRFFIMLSRATGVPFPDGSFPTSRTPSACLAADGFAPAYLAGEILSKFDDKKRNVEKERSTWVKFQEAEDLCRDTNGRLAVSGFRGPYSGVLERARVICQRILGPFHWDSAAPYMGWGPGASTRLPRRQSDAAYKYSGKPESTGGNAALAIAAIRSIPSWEQLVRLEAESDQYDQYITVVPGNRIVTVPKNYKTDRTIAIEPDMNMYIQKGIGGYMRKRLRFAGCDLNDQTRNQRLAKVGSITGRLATIDLSMASDTVSRQLVSRLLPDDWVSALEQCRSPFGILPSGEKIFYQKFSSMGNGFTFELESLIFYSLALAWAIDHGEEVHRISVYGDDIILPSALAPGFIGLLQFVGFRTNEKKSYWTGPFRESCGKHFHGGSDVTPFYVRRAIQGLPDLFLLHNNLYRWLGKQEWMDSQRRAACTHLLWWVRQYAPAAWRKPRLFDGYGDGAFIGNFDEITPTRCPRGREGWIVEVLAERSSLEIIDVPGLLPSGLAKAGRGTLHPRLDNLEVVEPPTSVYPVTDRRMRAMKAFIPQYALGRYLNGMIQA